MVSLHEKQLSPYKEITSRYEKIKSTGQVQSSKCSLTLITGAQWRAGDQLDQNFHHTGELVSTHNRFASNLPFQQVGNLMQFVCNFWCNFCAFRPTWRPNDTELKISDCARHTWPSNVTVKKSTADGKKDRQWERWRKAREGLWICANGCMYGYGHGTTAEITQNTFGTECMAIALTFSRVCSFDVTQKSKMTMIRSFSVPLLHSLWVLL